MPPRAKKENHGIDLFFFFFLFFLSRCITDTEYLQNFTLMENVLKPECLNLCDFFILSNFATFIKKKRKRAANIITIALFERDSDLFECDTKIEIRLIALYFSIK